MHGHRLIGTGLVALGAGIAANALLGPLALRLLRFHNSPSGITQLIGGEALSLVVVAPLAVAAGVLWRREHRVAPALALAPAIYALYTYTTEVVGAEYGRYPGNSARFLPLHLGLLALAGVIAARSSLALAAAPAPSPSTRLRIASATVLLVPNVLFALAWAAQLAAYAGGERSLAYQDDPRLWWLIKALDLGLVIPVCLAAGIGLLLRWPLALKVAPGLTGFLVCLVGAVGAMGLVQVAQHDPAASWTVVVVATLAALAEAGVTVWLLRPTTDTEVSPARSSTSSVPAEELIGGEVGVTAPATGGA